MYKGTPMNEIYLVDEHEDGTKFVGPKINLVGPSDADAFQAWAESQFLKLTGGILTGYLKLQQDYTLGEVPSNTRYGNRINFIDQDGFDVGAVVCMYLLDGSVRTVLQVAHKAEDGSVKYRNMGVYIDSAGVDYGIAGTPPENAAANALQTKESVTRDFLPRIGGEMTGSINYIADIEAGTPPASSMYPGLIFKDINNQTLAYVQMGLHADGSSLVQIGVRHFFDTTKFSSLYAGFNADGATYTYAPPTRDNYGNDIVTTKYAKDNFAHTAANTVTTYVSANGSDTADINNGRGLSIDKPFKSIQATVNWFGSHYATDKDLLIYLLTDIEEEFLTVDSTLCKRIVISSDSSVDRTIKLRRWIFRSVHAVLYGNLAFNAYKNDTTTALFEVAYFGVLEFNKNVAKTWTVSGSARTFVMANTFSLVYSKEITYSGSFTGQKYTAYAHAHIISNGAGVNLFPGDAAGYLDATSTYV